MESPSTEKGSPSPERENSSTEKGSSSTARQSFEFETLVFNFLQRAVDRCDSQGYKVSNETSTVGSFSTVIRLYGIIMRCPENFSLTRTGYADRRGIETHPSVHR